MIHAFGIDLDARQKNVTIERCSCGETGTYMQHRFRISSSLKDIIGRDLITNDFVAIFELVKNAFDAHAETVDIEFDVDRITICDNGKGMSQGDILEKWLFVAYSAKKTGEEDANLPHDYRNAISGKRGYAGNKGIGRFSCDRLGEGLELYSRSINGTLVEHLVVDWTDFEQDPKSDFASVAVDLSSISAFPQPKLLLAPVANGTMLVITRLREVWHKEKIQRLRDYLAKLVDPFETTSGLVINIHSPNPDWKAIEGPVGNQIMDILDQKTSRIEVTIKGGIIHTTLHDRGVLIYEIEEDNPFDALSGCTVEASLYFLNRSAKVNFTSRMGVQPVQFGNLFLFVNGFRVYPIGEPTDDTFGINRRKQQGTARYLGLRDIVGKVNVAAPLGLFREASSRDAGLTDTPAKVELYDAVMRFVLQRLERYVVNVNWADSLDGDREDAHGLKSDSARSRIIRIIGAMAGSQNVRLLAYDKELVDIVNERSAEFEQSMQGLALVAQKTGDEALFERVERSRQRFLELKASEADAKRRADEEMEARREAERRARAAELRAFEAGVKLERVEKQAQLLLNSQAQGSDELQLMHHQVIIYASEVQALTRRSMRQLGGDNPPIETVMSNLEQIAFQNSRILAVTRLATQAAFKLDADKITADMLQYMKEYVEKVAVLYGDVGTAIFETNDLTLEREFQPIDIAIVLDNLFTNAGKFDARKMTFVCRRASGGNAVEIVVSDDGRGIDRSAVDEAKIFERGYSGSPRGSGLGLYHTKQVLEGMGGTIALDPDRPVGKAQFVLRLSRERKTK